MAGEAIRPFQRVIFLPEQLKDRMEYLRLDLQEIFSLKRLTGKVDRSLLSDVLKLNRLETLEKLTIEKGQVFYQESDILNLWSQDKDCEMEIEQIKSLAALPVEGGNESTRYVLLHNERTLFLVVDGELPNLLNPIWSSIRRDLLRALCNYYKPYVVARHPLFRVYLDDLKIRT